jgi:uncharacterized tellurite resistance protein B-like protein
MNDAYSAERQRRHAEAESERRLIAHAIGIADADVGIADADVVLALEAADYRSDTIVLLELAPAVQVAWADGTISPRERELLLTIARREHILPRSPAYAELHRWLDRPPPAYLFRTSLWAIGLIVRSLHPRVGDALRRKLIGDCAMVATAATGILACGHPDSHDAQQVVVRIARELSPAE